MDLWFFLSLVFVATILILAIVMKISYETRKKRRAVLFAEIKKDLVFSLLVNMAETAGFKIEIHDSWASGMIIFFRSKKIWILGGLLNAFAEKEVPIEGMRLCLAHELGHLRKRTEVNCQLRQNLMNDCLYVELSASLEALSILKEVGEKDLEKYQNAWSSWLAMELNKQCKKCLKQILISKCPKKEDTRAISQRIEKMLKIKK